MDKDNVFIGWIISNAIENKYTTWYVGVCQGAFDRASTRTEALLLCDTFNVKYQNVYSPEILKRGDVDDMKNIKKALVKGFNYTVMILDQQRLIDFNQIIRNSFF